MGPAKPPLLESPAVDATSVRPPSVARAITTDSWTALRAHTPARIALGRVGASLPTQASLAFALAHAQARDAVHAPLDVAALQNELSTGGWSTIEVRSAAPDRAAYLARPDWGRRLDDAGAEAIDAARPAGGCDVLFVLADGLSATAVQQHAAPLLTRLKPQLSGFRIAPVAIATQARVALADALGAGMGAAITVCLIGERPGLSSADSLGAYVTFGPRPGRSDAERNCISNIRPGGLGFDAAARQLAALIVAMRAAKCSGVALRFDPARALSFG